jgi:hypothetical protein
MKRNSFPVTVESHLTELRGLLQNLLRDAGGIGHLVDCQEIKPGVYRLRCGSDGRLHSFVAKRLKPNAAWRNQLAARRWLPRLDLGQSGPPLLGVASDPKGQYIWHLYEDLGNCALDGSNPELDQLEAVAQIIAQVHTRFADHPLLVECRLWGSDLGMGFYSSNVRDAIRCIEALRLRRTEFSSKRQALVDRLLRGMYRLLDEEPYRAQVMAEFGGPETLLHGDLWPTNTLVFRAGNQVQVRLIDWDRAGTGPISYDLSSFLYRVPPGYRNRTLQYYREFVGKTGRQLPPLEILNLLFDTAERARLVNRIVWGAVGALDGAVEWGFEELEAFDRWLEALEPVLSSGE